MTHTQFMTWFGKFESKEHLARYLGCGVRHVEKIIYKEAPISAKVTLKYIQWGRKHG